MYLRCYVYDLYDNGLWRPGPGGGRVYGRDVVQVGEGPFKYGGELNLTGPLMGDCIPLATPPVDGLQLGSLMLKSPGASMAADAEGLNVAYVGGRISSITSYYGPGPSRPTPDDLYVPPELAERLKPLVDNITRGCNDSACRAERIKDFLRGFEYLGTMDSPWPDIPPGVDPVLWFLQERRGVCVHFATAFVMMARVAGVPSRLVVGYVSEGPVPRNWTLVAFAPHAWAEYYDGAGWVDVETTPGLVTANAANASAQPAPAPNSTQPTPPPPASRPAEAPHPSSWAPLLVLLPALAAAASAIGVFKRRVVLAVGEPLRIGGPRGFSVYVNRRFVGKAPVDLVFDKPGLYVVRVGPAFYLVRVVDYRYLAGKLFKRLLRRLRLPPSTTPREVAEMFPEHREAALLAERLRFGPRASADDYRRLEGLL